MTGYVSDIKYDWHQLDRDLKNHNLWPAEMLISRGKGALWGLAEICTIMSNDNCHDGHDDENFDDDNVAAADDDDEDD